MKAGCIPPAAAANHARSLPGSCALADLTTVRLTGQVLITATAWNRHSHPPRNINSVSPPTAGWLLIMCPAAGNHNWPLTDRQQQVLVTVVSSMVASRSVTRSFSSAFCAFRHLIWVSEVWHLPDLPEDRQKAYELVAEVPVGPFEDTTALFGPCSPVGGQ